MLAIEDLSVTYGKVPAVQNVSFEVAEGQIVALVGPNGAGKTTVLDTIFGHVRPRRGRIEFDGESLIGKSPEAIARRGLALVPEGRHIFATLTVAENLRLGALARRGTRAVGPELDALIERFPVLARYRGSRAGLLSGGEQQQLAIARALIARPRLLLLDEPSLGLSPRLTSQVFQILQELRQEGLTILLVEQNASQVLKFADVSYVLRAGRRVAAGGRELVDDGLVQSLYLGS